MKIEWRQESENYVLHYKSVMVAFHTTEYQRDNLFLFVEGWDKAICCLNKGSRALEKFEKLWKEG